VSRPLVALAADLFVHERIEPGRARTPQKALYRHFEATLGNSQ
jgi:hypothetical protein